MEQQIGLMFPGDDTYFTNPISARAALDANSSVSPELRKHIEAVIAEWEDRIESDCR